jgi:hypothetical protein
VLDLRPVIIASGQGFELVERVSDELREVLLVGFVDPAFERDLEDKRSLPPRSGSRPGL